MEFPDNFVTKIARLDDDFSKVFEQEASPVEGRSLQKKRYKKEKKERPKI